LLPIVLAVNPYNEEVEGPPIPINPPALVLMTLNQHEIVYDVILEGRLMLLEISELPLNEYAAFVVPNLS
jgi:hypothetical protein